VIGVHRGWRHQPPPFFSNVGTDGARKPDNVSRKKREVSKCSSSLSERRDPAGNSFEKMISQWGQMSLHDDLSPLAFDV